MSEEAGTAGYDTQIFSTPPLPRDFNLTSGFLLHRDLRDLQIRIRVVPLCGDVLKGRAERLALAGREWGQVEVHGFVVRSAGAQNADGKFFALGRLSEIVLERDLHHRVAYGLIAGVGNGAIEIADGCANKILRRTCRQVGEFQVRCVWWRYGGLLVFRAENQRENADHNPYNDDPDEDRTQTGLLPLRRGVYVRLDQAVHGGIVLPPAAYECELASPHVGRRCFRGVPRCPRIGNPVVLVFNRQSGAPAEPDVAYRLVASWKPEILHLHIFVMNFVFLRPE